jgi:hypothetical protein
MQTMTDFISNRIQTFDYHQEFQKGENSFVKNTNSVQVYISGSRVWTRGPGDLTSMVPHSKPTGHLGHTRGGSGGG